MCTYALLMEANIASRVCGWICLCIINEVKSIEQQPQNVYRHGMGTGTYMGWDRYIHGMGQVHTWDGDRYIHGMGTGTYMGWGQGHTWDGDRENIE